MTNILNFGWFFLKIYTHFAINFEQKEKNFERYFCSSVKNLDDVKIKIPQS